MPVIHRSVATLRIIGDDLLPEEITRLVGHAPSCEQKKGDVIRSQNGKERVAKFGMWRLKATDREPSDPDAQVEEIFAKLTTDLEVWRQIGSLFRCDLFFGIFMEDGNEGLSLSPATLLTLGSRGIKADFDIYGPFEKEPEPIQRATDNDGAAPRHV